MKRIKALVLMLFSVSAYFLSAQLFGQSETISNIGHKLTPNEGSFIYAIHDGKIVHKQDADPNAVTDIIVQLKDDPLAKLIANGIDKIAPDFLIKQAEILLTQSEFIASTKGLRSVRLNNNTMLCSTDWQFAPGNGWYHTFNQYRA